MTSRRSRVPNPPSDTHRTFSYSASGTDSASNDQARVFDLGTLKAGMTIRVGTCPAGGDMPSASATGETYLRVLVNGWERGGDDDGCRSANASYLTYTLPYTASVQIKAGCYSSLSCSGILEVAYDHPDSNGSISNVKWIFNGLLGNAPSRNKPSGRRDRRDAQHPWSQNNGPARPRSWTVCLNLRPDAGVRRGRESLGRRQEPHWGDARDRMDRMEMS